MLRLVSRHGERTPGNLLRPSNAARCRRLNWKGNCEGQVLTWSLNIKLRAGVGIRLQVARDGHGDNLIRKIRTNFLHIYSYSALFPRFSLQSFILSWASTGNLKVNSNFLHILNMHYIYGSYNCISTCISTHLYSMDSKRVWLQNHGWQLTMRAH